MINSALPSNLIRNKQVTIIEANYAFWNGKDSANIFSVPYLIDADGAFVGRVPCKSVIPVIYTLILK